MSTASHSYRFDVELNCVYCTEYIGGVSLSIYTAKRTDCDMLKGEYVHRNEAVMNLSCSACNTRISNARYEAHTAEPGDSNAKYEASNLAQAAEIEKIKEEVRHK